MSAANLGAGIRDGYRRFLIDLHIADWDAEFLSRLDPDEIVRSIASTGAKTTNVPANAHTGLNYWSSAVGREHRRIAGTDLFGRFVTAARNAGLNPVAYYCTVYVDWYWDHYPEARIVDAAGDRRKVTMLSTGKPRRFSCCCLNNEAYRAFCRTQLHELVSRYDVAAVNLDMTFWPTICYCETCEGRSLAELGRPIPRQVAWSEAPWLEFVARRQEWLVEFIDDINRAANASRPGLPILHQSQAYTQDWFLGASEAAAARTAWLAADLYRPREELSFVFKLFNSLSPSLPFEQISSWAYPDIFEHTTVRTESELEEIAFLPITNDAAITFIDVIDPNGEHATDRYPIVTRLFERIADLEPVLGGEMQQDVGIYVSFAASFDLEADGADVSSLGYAFEPDRDPPGRGAHRVAASSAATTLMQHHIPFGILTRNDLDRLHIWSAIVLPNVAFMTSDEIAAFQRYVADGGGLYASAATSTIGPTGRRDTFGLADVFGVDRLGTTDEIVTFSTPTQDGEPLYGEFDSRRPLAIHGRQERTEINAADARVLATLTLPYTDPTAPEYALIITDPPGRPTGLPSVVRRACGRGRVIYSAGALEAETHSSQRAVFAALVRDLLVTSPAFEADAPSCVEFTLFDRPDLDSLLLYALNVQADSPPIPVGGMVVRLTPHDREIVGVQVAPSGEKLPFTTHDDRVTVNLPTCERLLVLQIRYRRTDG